MEDDETVEREDRRPLLPVDGGWIDPLGPDPTVVRLDLIGRALSRRCRYGGHGAKFYSVAEHAVLVATAVDELGGDNAAILWALLHDAGEAFVADVPAPLRPFLRAGPTDQSIDEIEDDWLVAIGDRFGLAGPVPQLVQQVDRRIVADEAAVLFPGRTDLDLPQPLGELVVQGLSPEAAYDTWLEAACEALLRHQGVIR